MSNLNLNVNFVGFCKNLSNNEKAKKVYGVYAVFSCVENENSIDIKKLLYIGQAKDETIAKRHENHEKLKEWERKCEKGEKLYYAFAEVEKKYIDNVEAILINNKKPVCNEVEHKINKENLELDITGCCAKYLK